MHDHKQIETARRYRVGFSITGSLIILCFLAFINYSSGSSFPWFLFPAYAVLWWPLVTIVNGRDAAKIMSLIGSLATIALLVLVNYLTSWPFPWFVFPAFAVLWWPLTLFFGVKNYKHFSISGSLVLTVFFMITNLVLTPSVLWFIDPIFVVLWWPLSAYLAKGKTMKSYAILGALAIISYVSIKNWIETPAYPWAVLTYFPIIFWPAAVLLGKRLGRLKPALLGSGIGIFYYALLNFFLFHGFPWAIFTTYALVWWPLAIAFAKRGQMLGLSFIGSLISAALVLICNAVTTPTIIWSVYPIFGLAWWPLSIYYFVHRRPKNDLSMIVKLF